MQTLLLVAVRNLLQNRKRSLLLGTAIALVTMLLVLLSALFNGMQTTMLRSATTLMTGHVNVAGFYKVTSGMASPVVTKYAELEDLVRKSTPGLQSVVVRGRGWGKIISETSSQQSAIVGIDVVKETGFREVVQVKSGTIEGLKEPHTILIFNSVAERLDVKVGDNLTISSQTYRGINNTVDVRIVAIAKDLSMFSAFNAYVPQDTIRDLYLLDPSTTGAIQVYLKDPEQAEAVSVILRQKIQAAGYRVMDRVSDPFWQKFPAVKREDWTGQKIDITTWTDEMKFMRYTLQTFSVLIAILVSVLLVIIVIGVMNTLWMSIRERTREVGTLRAIGMQQRSVGTMFMLEAAVLALAATLVGTLLATLLAAGINGAHVLVPKSAQMFLMSETWRLLVDVPTALRSLVIISLVTTLGAIYPAWRAARLQPVTAMQST
jgi:putative ABC transport system permease protein